MSACPHCNGTGTYFDKDEGVYREGIDCAPCDGTGRYFNPDPDAHDIPEDDEDERSFRAATHALG